MVFFSEASEDIFKCLFEAGIGLISGKREPAVFDKTP
jgi:hypothetical protein